MASQTLTPVYGRLLALHRDVQQSEYWLEVKQYNIGRDARSCEIVVERGTVGRIHAVLVAVGSHFLLRDLRSTNGTFVDGERIQDDQLLVHGQEIGLASPEPLFIFEDSGQTLITAMPASATPDHPEPEILRYDEKLKLFFLNGQRLELTLLQFRLLDHLYQHRGQVCTREALAGAVWSDDLDGRAANDLDKLLFHLRKRLRKVDPNPDLIKLHRGFGYLLEV